MIAKCTQCHHEWQAVLKPGKCAWCGAPGKKLANDYIEKTTELKRRIKAARETC
jgi:hypothetical protein